MKWPIGVKKLFEGHETYFGALTSALEARHYGIYDIIACYLQCKWLTENELVAVGHGR